MAIKKSNLYAEKIFAEHPLALWPLDDDISYIQLFDLSSSATTIKRKNLITNPSFSASAAGWSASAGTSLSYSSSTMTISNTSGSARVIGAYFNTKMYTETKNKHTFSIYARSSTGTNNMKAIIRWYKYANQWIPTTGSAGYFSYNTYQSGLSEGTVTSVGTTTTRVSITDYPKGSFGEVYIVSASAVPTSTSVILSKAVFEDNDLVDFYFDGNSADSNNINILSLGWGGASGQSVSNIVYQVGYQDRQTANLSNTTYWDTGSLIPIVPVTSYGTNPIDGTSNYEYQSSASTSLIRSKVPIKTGTSGSSDSLFDRSKSTACFSTFIYNTGNNISSIEIGTMSGSAFLVSSSTIYNSFTSGWNQISNTFTIPNNTDLYLYMRTVYKTTGGSASPNWKVQFSGLSLGQWSETFNGSYDGFNPQTMPNNIKHLINDSDYYTVATADSYGLDTSQNGYYLIKNKNYFCRTSGIPMIYGSDHTTKVFEATDLNPSIIIPGMGLFNEAGKYNNYTLEAWVRIESYESEPVRIIGPMASEDGIYVEEGFISLKIGPYYQSYFIGKWSRPMLLHVTYTQNLATMMINGEQVIEIPIDTNKIDTFPSYDYKTTGYTNDWIGIYGYDEIILFELDTVSIFPYILPSTLAKRRFVFGQGVGEINITTSKATGNPFIVDYSNSNYAANLIYPDIRQWSNQTVTNNIDSSQSYLTTPQHELPEITMLNKTLTEDTWLQANFYQNTYQKNNIDYPFFKMQPPIDFGPSTIQWGIFTSASPAIGWNSNTQWVALIDSTWLQSTYIFDKSPTTLTASAAISFPSLKVINRDVQSFILVAEASSASVSSSSTQTIVSFKNKVTAEIFDIVLQGTTLKYRFNNNDLRTETILPQQDFIVGINFSEISDAYYNIYPTLKTFFLNQDAISMNIGSNFENCFNGKIYAVHFNDSTYHQKDFTSFFMSSSPSFAKQVTTNIEFSYLLDYTASYSLKPKLSNSTMFFDIGVAGYWEDVQHLTYFAKYVNDASGNQVYTVDHIQFNIDVPLEKGTATYENLTEYQNVYQTYDVADASIKTYLTFQNSASVGRFVYSSLSTQYLTDSKIIEFDISKFATTKYEIVDNTIIIPPSSNLDKYYIGIHIEFKIDGIIEKSVLVKSLQLSSFARNKNSKTAVGSRYAKNIYPFTKNNSIDDYITSNPFTIYKRSTPYLYLSSDSGIFKNEYPSISASTQGLQYIINEQQAQNYYCGGVQAWIRYPNELFTSTMPIISVSVGNTEMFLLGVPEDGGKRMRVDVSSDSGYSIYQDGVKVNKLYLNPREWTAVNISFTDPQTISANGYINMYRGFSFNNIFDYQYYPRQINKLATNLFITWNKLRFPDDINQVSWSAVYTTASVSWLSATSAGVANPEQIPVNSYEIYNNQIGVSNTIIEDDNRISIISNGVSSFTDVVWKIYEATPA